MCLTIHCIDNYILEVFPANFHWCIQYYLDFGIYDPSGIFGGTNDPSGIICDRTKSFNFVLLFGWKLRTSEIWFFNRPEIV